MENDDEEELVEAEVPRGRMNPKHSTSREKQEHEDSGHAGYMLFTESCCAAYVEGRGIGGQHRIELLDEEKRKRATPIVAFSHGLMTREHAGTSPILIGRGNRCGQTGATCCDEPVLVRK